jgi:hypothetical protein
VRCWCESVQDRCIGAGRFGVVGVVAVVADNADRGNGVIAQLRDQRARRLSGGDAGFADVVGVVVTGVLQRLDGSRRGELYLLVEPAEQKRVQRERGDRPDDREAHDQKG